MTLDVMATDEQLPRQIHRDLRAVGWTKATDLAKVARRERLIRATWLHKAKQVPKGNSKMKSRDI